MELRYRQLVESSPDGILILEGERLTFVNQAAVDLFGAVDASDLLERPVCELFTAGPDFSDWLRRSKAGEAVPPMDVALVPRDGSQRFLSLTCARLGSDRDTAVQLVARDVTRSRQAERALRESEERLSLAVAGAQQGVWDWNLETNEVLYSARWKQMLGYSEDEIEPHLSAWARLVHPDDKLRAESVHESVARGEHSTYESEFRLRHKDGHYVHVLSRGFPVHRVPGGPAVRIVGIHLDLTEQRRVEAALRENEERLQLAFAGAQEGVWDWNLETGAVVYSTRWKQMLGYGDDDIEPHVAAWERLLHPDDLEQARRVNESVGNGAPTYGGEFRLRHKDGHYVHVLSRGYPVRRDPNGPVVRIVGTHFDLTERKRVEAERSRTEFLRRLVFAQEDERRRIAREMHDQFGERLTALAHQLRTLKMSDSAADAWRDHVGSIETIVQQLDRDVDNLVWQLRPTALDDLGLRAALANYVQDWSARVGIPASVHTTGLLDDRLERDVETALYRIAQEALTNVAKHARAQQVEVILERRGDNVLLIVEDDGIGLDAAAPGEAGPGHGFGLVGMKERAGLIDATVEIESSPGNGTTVFVRVAAGDAAGPAAQHD